MFDSLRDDAASSFEVDDIDLFPEETPLVKKQLPKRKSYSKFLGMTPVQRFLIAIMLMIAVCTLGVMCLLLTGRIGLL